MFITIFSQNSPIADQMKLVPRASTDSTLILLLFALCVVFFAVARYSQRTIFVSLVQSSFLFHTHEDQLKEGSKRSRTSSFLLITQFLLITAGVIYWYFFIRTPLNNLAQLWIPLFFPGIYLLYQVLMVYVAGFITSSKNTAVEINYFTLGLAQVFGVVLFVVFFVSYFQPNWLEESQLVLLFTYLAFLVLRFFRCFFIALWCGVKWYYIILYFWSLEILPLLIVVKWLFNDEFQTWMG